MWGGVILVCLLRQPVSYLHPYTCCIIAWVAICSQLWAHYREEGWPDFKMVAPINVLAFSQRYHRQGTNTSVEKYIEQVIEPAPVCSSNSNVYSNYFKVLGWLKKKQESKLLLQNSKWLLPLTLVSRTATHCMAIVTDWRQEYIT